jgi:Sulfotransferase family
MNKPHFLCIGAQKAGTTWLFYMLREHPEVWLGPFKELQFFNARFVESDAVWVHWHIENQIREIIRYIIAVNGDAFEFEYMNYLLRIADRQIMFSDDWYTHVFSRGGDKVKGDITPAYCAIPAEGVEYALNMLGPVPVIFLVRDPVERALSQLRMNVTRALGPAPKEGGPIWRQGARYIVRRVARARKRPITRSPPLTRAQWEQFVADPEMALRGDYPRDIGNWLSRYPEEKLLFIPYREIASEPLNVLRQVEKHIGVGAFNYSNVNERVFEGDNILLPPFVTEMIQQQFQPQRDFLEQTFGKDFVRRI